MVNFLNSEQSTKQRTSCQQCNKLQPENLWAATLKDSSKQFTKQSFRTESHLRYIKQCLKQQFLPSLHVQC